MYINDKKNINISNVKITSLSVNPKIFKPNATEIGFKTPNMIIRMAAIIDIFPNFINFSFFIKPIPIKNKNKIVRSTVIPVIIICIMF